MSTNNIILTTPAELEELLEQTTLRAVKACLTLMKLPTGGQGEEYLKKREAARLLNVSTATIDNYVRRGKLAKYPFGNQQVRFKRQEVLALIKQ
ncbi:excisionase family DNA binding protein [Lewinella marina]|uniref:Helix-turn-helix domain-containing protein n=1 Tax=Neolewinella marina TaxID=438751 RepID=A0A2G0CHF9_9BACT|nr:helix-turn-helix domain-containing protein [Neolewinella marina]NJB86162.1 excisionase family DNA binding protein [Neolewinella marina]PHK99360.1 hypothetical protein CGL56_07875 [Neolewinella marina]